MLSAIFRARSLTPCDDGTEKPLRHRSDDVHQQVDQRALGAADDADRPLKQFPDEAQQKTGREHRQIHGSPDLRLICKTANHGCVRLTNWDEQELA